MILFETLGYSWDEIADLKAKGAIPERVAGAARGIRVLDLATMLAGPYAATLLGDLGADVVKVESHYGDDSRTSARNATGQRSPFLSLNRNKRSFVPRSPAAGGAGRLREARRDERRVITNVRGPALSKLGLATSRCERTGRRHLGRRDGFGPDGPVRGRPGIDFLAQGYAGCCR
jgi:crotonobetainyl-CoA:carnitine CoA-transferase CaiB-like acyl-CoA transferase